MIKGMSGWLLNSDKPVLLSAGQISKKCRQCLSITILTLSTLSIQANMVCHLSARENLAATPAFWPTPVFTIVRRAICTHFLRWNYAPYAHFQMLAVKFQFDACLFYAHFLAVRAKRIIAWLRTSTITYGLKGSLQ